MHDTVNRDEAAALLGVQPSAVSSTLARKGVVSAGREAGRGGQSVYRRADVERVAALPKQQGYRTDLTRKPGPK